MLANARLLPRCPRAPPPRRYQLSGSSGPYRGQHRAACRDTLMRFVAMGLLGWGMREKDIRYLCEVPEYF